MKPRAGASMFLREFGDAHEGGVEEDRTRRRGAVAAEIPRLRRFARVLARGDAAQADDLVQETLLRALGSLDGFREDAGLATWMTRIMLNIHRSEHRRTARRRAYEARVGGEEPVEPARQELRAEVAATLDALDALPEDQRVAVALVAARGLTYAQAAETLGVPLGTLMSRVSRGRAAIRRRVEGTGGDARKRTETDR
jgi:RNA polymerase sigma-70 factor (ECF subfamily)